MSNRVTIVVYDRQKDIRRNFSISVDESENIGNIIQRVETETGIPSSELEVIFCGKKLDRNTQIHNLSLSPATQLTILRPKNSPPLANRKSDSNSPVQEVDVSAISSFFVYCKSCSGIKHGKLRIYCQNCSSSSVIVNTEPQNWDDVLKSNRIRVNCENCQKSNNYANFKFKCVTCHEVCAALTHVLGNWQLSECCVCYSTQKIIINLGCNHSICEQCFRDYLLNTLKDFSFISRPPYGYTISCAYPGCNRVVKDVHHFYIMGKENYQEYQRRATEKLVTRDDEGLTCPNPKCGQIFYWEPYDDDSLSQCPECHSTFCRKCNERDCICQSENDLTRTTIEATTRKCPKCKVATEKNGGCSHIHCTYCGMDWCFKCVGEWKEECQWDHWF